jgi:hypothetical protein
MTLAAFATLRKEGRGGCHETFRKKQEGGELTQRSQARPRARPGRRIGGMAKTELIKWLADGR